jgi:hypothetical protein
VSNLQPNLASLNVTELEVTGRLPLGRDRVREIMAHEKQDASDILIFANSYDVDGNEHFASAVAFPVSRKPDVLEVSVTFSVSPPLLFRHEKAKPVSHFFDLLAKQPVETTLRCALSLSYPSRRWASSVRLPMSLFDVPAMPFDEIRGFRAVKFANATKTRYSIIVDRPENRDYYQSINFSFTASLTSPLIDTLLRDGVSISLQFVRPREVTARRTK